MRPQRHRDIRLLGEAEAQFDAPDAFRQLFNDNPGVLRHSRRTLCGHLQSKGQFYPPAEVSRVIAQILGIREAKTSNDTAIYDPTCGSGSLLLKVAEEARTPVSLYGQ